MFVFCWFKFDCCCLCCFDVVGCLVELFACVVCCVFSVLFVIGLVVLLVGWVLF